MVKTFIFIDMSILLWIWKEILLNIVYFRSWYNSLYNNGTGLEVFFRFLSGSASVNIKFLMIFFPPCCCDHILVLHLTGGVSDSHLPLCHAARASDAWHHPSRSGPGNHLLPQAQHHTPGRPTGTKNAYISPPVCVQTVPH